MSSLIRPGFWALSADSSEIWCPLGVKSCMGGTISNSSSLSCVSGFSGPLCGDAVAGKAVNSITQNVELCSAATIAVPVTLSIASICLLVYYVFWLKARKGVVVDEEEEIDPEAQTAQRTESGDSSIISIMILLYLSMQLCSNVPLIFQVTFPSSSTALMQYMVAFSLSSPQFLGWTCLSEILPMSSQQLNHFELMQLAVALPAAAFLLASIITLGIYEALEREKESLLTKRRNNKNRINLLRVFRRQDLLWTRYTTTISTLYLIALYGILNLTASTFACVDLGGGSNLTVLYAQPNLSCSGSGYDIARAWAAIGLFIYGVIIPMLFVMHARVWNMLMMCWRWLTCDTSTTVETADIEVGGRSDENAVPPPPPPEEDALPPSQGPAGVSVRLFLSSLVLRFFSAVILPFLPGNILNNDGQANSSRPTLPRALIAVFALSLALGLYQVLTLNAHEQERQFFQVLLIQLILLSVAVVVLCQWQSAVDSTLLDIVIIVTLLSLPLHCVWKHVIVPHWSRKSGSVELQEDDDLRKRKINYFAVRRLFMLAHGLSDSQTVSRTEDRDDEEEEEEKARSPIDDDIKRKRGKSSTTSSSSTAATALDMDSIPPPPPTSSPPPTTNTTTSTAYAGRRSEYRGRRGLRHRPPPLPFPAGVAAPSLRSYDDEDEEEGGSWGWLAEDDFSSDYDLHRGFYREDSPWMMDAAYHDRYYRPYQLPVPYNSPSHSQWRPPRTPPRHLRRQNGSYYRSPRGYHSSPAASLTSISSRDSSCPSCDYHQRTMSSACVQLDDVYDDCRPHYLTYHRNGSHLARSSASTINSSGGRSHSNSKKRGGTKSRSLIQVSSESEEEKMIDESGKVAGLRKLSSLQSKEDQNCAKEEQKLKGKVEQGEEVVKRAWWDPVFLADII